MKRVISGHISRTVYLVLLLAFLPSFLILFRFGLERNAIEQSETQQRIQDSVNAVAKQQERIAENINTLAETIITFPEIRNLQRKTSIAVFSNLIDSEYNDIVNIYAVDTSGKVLIAGRGEAKYLPDVAKEDLKKVEQSKTFYASSLTTDPGTKEPTIFFFSPIVEEGNIKAVLAFALNVNRLKASLYTQRRIPYSHFLLVDSRGKMVYSYPASPEDARYAQEAQDILSQTNSNLGIKLLRIDAEDERILAYEKGLVPGLNQWFITAVLSIDTKDAYASATKSLHKHLINFSLVMGLCFLFVIFSVRQTLQKPLRKLIATAKSIGEGHLEARVVIPRSGGEIATLATTLNTMAEALELRNKEIMDAKSQADEANRIKSEFLANMSHEIRTPMNAIIGMAYLVLRTDLNQQQKDYINKIYVAGNTLLGIINDILDFSKIEADKLDIEQIPFSLEEVIENVGSLLYQKAEEKKIELLFSLSPLIPQHLIGDPLRINQILINLINNAIKFTPKGEVVVTCKVLDDNETPYLESKFKSGEELNLFFSVRDTGIGMNPKQVESLFEPFTQADSSTTRNFGGTGLGLTITKRLITMMKGRIWVNSAPNEGTTVSFIIRLVCSDHMSIQQITPSLKGVKVLIVDDNDSARIILSEMLKSLSLAPTAVASAKEAYAELLKTDRSSPYKLILLDWRMPDISGFETAEHIHSMNLANTPPITLITAFGKSDLQARAKAAGVQSILHKPVNPSQLFNTVLNALQMSGHMTSKAAHALAGATGKNDLKGLSILLAEDNIVNQQVALEILSAEGIQVTIANNGAQAIELLLADRDKYHLILMDLQMPIMDGYEATRKLRKYPKFANIPIIAMTAHAMKDEKDACLKVGMNDHVSKPIEVDKLFSVVRHWLPYTSFAKEHLRSEIEYNDSSEHGSETTQELLSASVAAMPLPSSSLGEKRIQDIPGIESEKALARLGGNIKLYEKSVRLFHQRLRQYHDEMRGFIDENDSQGITRLAHTVKGLAATIGATNLEIAAQELEVAEKDPLPAEEYIVNFLENILTLKRNCDSYLPEEELSEQEAGTAQEQNYSEEDSARIISEIKEFLDDNNPKAQEFFAEHKHFFKQHLKEDFAAFSTHLADFDFDDCLDILNK